MKKNLILPDPKHYHCEGINPASNKHIWQDKGNKYIEIHSTLENPFYKPVSCYFAVDKGRSRESRATGGAKYFKKLILKVSDENPDLEKGVLTREVQKGHFVYNNEFTTAFAAFPTEDPVIWIYYRLY